MPALSCDCCMVGHRRWYVESPEGYGLLGRRKHRWSFMMRDPDSRIVRVLKALPTVQGRSAPGPQTQVVRPARSLNPSERSSPRKCISERSGARQEFEFRRIIRGP